MKFSSSTRNKWKVRVTVSAVIFNKNGKVLLCKMPKDRGAYPGQWAIPGGGIKQGEKMVEALKREVREEVGLEIYEINQLHFQDARRTKLMQNGKKEDLYMIHLVFTARTKIDAVQLNDEFEEYVWVGKKTMQNYDLNDATVKTMRELKWL
jgi:nucleoside triphosphatase